MMNDIIFGSEAWRTAYNKRSNRVITWVVLQTDTDDKIYFRNYKCWSSEFLKWFKENNIKIKKFGLQYKSHEYLIDCKNADGIYVIKSVFGRMGGDSKQCFNIGVVNRGKVSKKVIGTPELLQTDEYEDTIENCFEEGLLLNNEKEANIIQ